jgi:hypothetical protein
MATATLFGIFIIPVLYVVVQRVADRRSPVGEGRTAVERPATAEAVQ